MTGLTGTGRLLRLAWRRDRIMIAITVGGVFVLVWSSIIALKGVYPERAQVIAMNEAANASSAVVSMYGKVHDVTSIGGIGTAKLLMILLIALALLVIAIIRRHTRAEEESGRFELLGATVMGRRAPLAAAVLLATVTSLVTGIVTAVGIIAGGFPAGGAWMLGAAVASVGLAWTGITAVAVQVSASNRTCGAFAFGALALAFVLRMIGDLTDGTPAGALSWLSPIGWAQQTRPFEGERWWVLVLPVLFFVAALVLADRLRASRDQAGGLLVQRRGPARGRLGTVGQLAWRLQSGSVLGWAVSFVLIGIMLGTIIGTLGGLVTSGATDMLRSMGGAGTMDDLYISTFGAFMALAAAAFGVASTLRMRAEETAAHLEPILATRTTRHGFLAAHSGIALACSAAMLASEGLALAIVRSATGTSNGFWRDVWPSVIQIPAVWVVIGLTMLLFAWVPRLSYLGWALLAAIVVLGEFGALLKLPAWVQELSPFAHTPKLPAEAFQAAPIAALLAIAVILVALSVVGFRRRDLTPG